MRSFALHPIAILGALLFAFTTSAQSADFRALLDREWEWTMEQSPTWASSLGDRRWNDRWEDIGAAAIEARNEHQRLLLKELEAMDRAALSEADQLNYDLLVRQLRDELEGLPFQLHLMPINRRGGIQTSDELADALRFDTVKDYEDWVARMRAFPAYMDQTIALMREGIRLRIAQPKVVIEPVLEQVDGQIVGEVAKHPFLARFVKMPSAIADTDQSRLRAEGAKAVTELIIPAFERLKTFLKEEYLPACYDEVGVWQHPQGAACYAHLARRFTTTALTPREIHDIGLREVERITAAMEKVKAQVRFPGTLAQFFEHLRTDKRFFYASSADLMLGYEAMSKRIDPTLVKLFRAMPRMPYAVKSIPDKIAPHTTTAYYREPAPDGSRAGTFFVNLFKPETRPKWEMMALSLHESVPGHHFQIALAQEQGELPEFRRQLQFTAYVEGWALYCESLGDELGLYDDPYDKFGQLTYDMWRAVRLVVDTGIHELRWSRDKAITFFRDHASKSEQDIVNEIDRYIGWPGQALAYKIGQLKIRELRTEAEAALGDHFDVRAFHDAVLLSGAVPLDVLQLRVREHIQKMKLKGAASPR